MMILWIPICVVSGILQWSAGHVVYPIEPPRRTRHSIDEWRPLKEEMALGLSRHSVRYPYFYKPTYSLLHKKSPLQQTDNSDKVEVFSSAPPSILGSLSVFGHATVNAREPASRITLKSSRPHIIPEQSEHHSHYHQHHNHHGHHAHELQNPSLPIYPSYDDRALYDLSLRPPPREHVAESAISLVPHPHSSSLTPNSYFFETPQPFQPPVSDLGSGFHKIRKPVYKPVTHNPYRLTSQLYTSVNPLDQFKTPTHHPTSYEDNLGFDRGMNKFSKYNIHLSKTNGLSSYYSRNPFGDIHLSTRRPDLKYSLDQTRNNVKDEYDQYSHGRPFQKPSSFTPSPFPQKEYDNKPYVTTYSSVSSTDNAQKYSSPQSYYPSYEAVSSAKPDYLVTHQPFTDSTFPYSVTTVEMPTVTSPVKVNEDPVQSNDKNAWDQTVKAHTSFEPSDARKPEVKINSFSGYNDREPLFLPTPSTDSASRVSPGQSGGNYPRPNHSPSNNVEEYQEEKKPEDTTEYFTTELPETTTKPMRQFTKNRRRPVNKHSDNFNKFSEFDDSSTYKGHRPDNHKRRRKPTYGGRGGDRNRQSEFKKQRTTTTTQEPEVYEPTLYNNEFSTLPVTEDVTINSQVFTTEISVINMKNDYDQVKPDDEQHADMMHFTDGLEEVEEKTAHVDIYMEGIMRESTSTTTHSPVPLTTVFSTPSTTTTEKSETSTSSTISNRLKNKYGNNRPRFSVKEYRERLNRGTSTTTPVPEETTEKIKSPVREQQDILKNTVRIRGSSQYKSSSDTNNSSTTDTKRKYKPRVGPSRYRISTSTSSSVSTALTTPTTERSNTFRPNTNRYKPGTGKYYSRYRTSTALPKDLDESTQAPAKIVVIKPKGVFSAKRKPYPLKTRLEIDKDMDEENISQEDIIQIGQGEIVVNKYSDTIRNFENEVAPATVLTKKMDSEVTTSSSEERDEGAADPISDPTGLEALRIADLTSSSSNDFHSSGFRINNHRTIPKIAFPTEEPILPLEAFFQNHANKE